ncbi:MAG: bifunctional precorrin-2 dehydrogenase/sirohydrochlorin ferrochelatase [Anaerolineaceae bacterium]|nr:bifunctional precorrin-2 dehydrogenase/sirohydrochlorin ferrochelatase [Anaerolineaceae bacterium]
MPSYYPVFLDLADRACLVVGGGEVARRKVESLLAAGAKVGVISPQVCDGLRQLGGVEFRMERYDPSALEGVMLVVAATDSAQTNARVFADCRARGVLCNVVDRPEWCDFIVPSVLRRGLLTVAVSTSGASPALAGRIRRQLEEQFDPPYGPYLEAIGNVRALIQSQVKDESQRAEIGRRLAADDVLEAARQGQQALAAKVAEILEQFGVRK